MAEHLSDSQIENFTTRRLAPGAMEELTRHLAACADCQARVNAKARTINRVAALQTTLRAEPIVHLPYEQLVAYVEETAQPIEREIIHNHLAACSQCTFEAEELQALRHSLAAKPAPKKSFAWLREFTFLRPLPIAIAAVALLSFFSLVWWLRQPATAPQIVSAPPAASPAVTASLPPAPAPIAPVVIASLQDNGQTVALDQAGNLTGLANLSKESEQALRQALATQQIEISPEVKPLRQRAATLMGKAEEPVAIHLQSPVGTFINDTQPILRWQALRGAEHYTVQVLDTDFNVVATSPALAQTSWRVTMPLKRGQEYLWQVTAEVAGQRASSSSASAPEAHFKLLSADKSRALQASLQSKNSHLLRGTMYARTGLLDEAEREYQALLKANPHSSIARKLWQQLRAVRKS
ncbi:MAG: hypothetical protein U0Y68_14670 [Blastocatellia bacterium]